MSVRILTGDCLAILPTLDAGSVQCCVTSPPYWGLRDYGHAGQLGLESSPTEYVEKMVAVFREVKRVLRDGGTLWLNLGDCYATGAGKVGQHPGGGAQGARWRGDVDRIRDDKRGYRGDRLVNTNGGTVTRPKTGSNRAQRGDGNGGIAYGPMTQPNRMPTHGLKPKDLAGIPWRVAFALQADGWYLRSDIIWSKPNPMPESVMDRPAKSHEYVFLLSKSERYVYDAAAIAEPLAQSSINRLTQPTLAQQEGSDRVPGKTNGKTKAVYRSGNKERDIPTTADGRGIPNDHMGRGIPWEDTGAGRTARTVWTIATQPYSGAHFATFPPKLAEKCILAGCPSGGTVLDPFGGAGTTGLVADRLGRNAILIEINAEYAKLAARRLHDDAPLLVELRP